MLSSLMKKREPKGVATASSINETPILSETIDHVPVYLLPNETGYFPTGYKDEILVSCSDCQIYQLQNVAQASEALSPSNQVTQPPLLSQGTLTLRDPAPGTPIEVALIGECNGVIFYVTNEDVTLNVSQTELVIICTPSLDCFYILLPSAAEEHVLSHIHGLFCARTNMYQDGETTISDDQIQSIRRSRHEENTKNLSTKKDPCCTGTEPRDDQIEDMEKMIPDALLHRSIYKSSVWIKKQTVLLGEAGAKKVEGHGDRWRESFQSSLNSTSTNKSNSDCEVGNGNGNKKIHPKAIEGAAQIRKFSKTARNAAEKVSDSVSNVVGGVVASVIAEKPTDSKTKSGARQLLRTSAIAYGEISDGVGEGFDVLSRAARREASACVAVKYGQDVADLTRHTLGATNNFVKTALTCRRILDVRKVAKSSVKSAVKQSRE